VKSKTYRFEDDRVVLQSCSSGELAVPIKHLGGEARFLWRWGGDSWHVWVTYIGKVCEFDLDEEGLARFGYDVFERLCSYPLELRVRRKGRRLSRDLDTEDWIVRLDTRVCTFVRAGGLADRTEVYEAENIKLETTSDGNVDRIRLADGKEFSVDPCTGFILSMWTQHNGFKRGAWEGAWGVKRRKPISWFAELVKLSPVWAHALKGMMIGAAVGIALKSVDTAITTFAIDSFLGVLWVVFAVISLGAMLNRWSGAAMIVWAGVAMILHGANFFFIWLATVLIGVLTVAPIGMAVGTVVGHFRKGRYPRSPNAPPEGFRPYLLGLVFPLVFSLLFIPAYFLWLIPLMAK